MKELSYWRFGIQYLNLSQHVAELIVESGNKFVVFSNKDITQEMFEEETKWSDYNVALPLFFNFYHGLEVVLKGFLLAKRNEIKHNHKLIELLHQFEEKFGRNELYNTISNYVVQDKLKEPLSSFFKKSSITTDEFYQALKYPESMKGNAYLYKELLDKGSDGVRFYKTLTKDINLIKREAVKVGYDIINKKD